MKSRQAGVLVRKSLGVGNFPLIPASPQHLIRIIRMKVYDSYVLRPAVLCSWPTMRAQALVVVACAFSANAQIAPDALPVQYGPNAAKGASITGNNWLMMQQVRHCFKEGVFHVRTRCVTFHGDPSHAPHPLSLCRAPPGDARSSAVSVGVLQLLHYLDARSLTPVR
jgi:hypothetical protein